MATLIARDEQITFSASGTFGPYYFMNSGEPLPTIWYDLGGATGITVEYSDDGGINYTPIAMTNTVGTHYENSSLIEGELPYIQFIVSGTPNASTLAGIV